jgi:hypothetical protein
MIYAVYKIIEEDPNTGYLWGKWTDPVELSYAVFNMAKEGFYDIKVVQYKNPSEITPFITW